MRSGGSRYGAYKEATIGNYTLIVAGTKIGGRSHRCYDSTIKALFMQGLWAKHKSWQNKARQLAMPLVENPKKF